MRLRAINQIESIQRTDQRVPRVERRSRREIQSKIHQERGGVGHSHPDRHSNRPIAERAQKSVSKASGRDEEVKTLPVGQRQPGRGTRGIQPSGWGEQPANIDDAEQRKKQSGNSTTGGASLRRLHCVCLQLMTTRERREVRKE